jgi:DNA-binding transcriptional LysR family regulator
MLLEDLQVIIKVAQFRSITEAADSLDMHIATASAAVKRVEKFLGNELFIRTTRQLRLSSAGERYIPQCEQALLMLEQAHKNMKHDMGIIEGELRFAVSSDLGRSKVIPWLDTFIEKHPNISLRVHISDSNIDFYRDSVDIAIRYGSPKDASVYGFKICNVPGVLCATPSYLAKHGTPSHPHDLPGHNGLFYQLHDIVHDIWTFSDSENNYKIKMSSNRIANDAEIVRRWCASGKGLAVKSCLDMAEDLISGKIVNIMPNFKPRATELWLVCPSRQSITPAVRLLRDMLRKESKQVLLQLIDEGILNREDCF